MDSGKERLIKNLVDEGYLKSPRVIKAFMDIPREEFVREDDRRLAYVDYPMSIPAGQTISAPHMVAIMTEMAEADRNDIILEIGGGSGYQAAILSRLVKKVYSIECDPELVAFAKSNLKRAKIKNVEIMHGDGKKGYEKAKPYDKIVVTCATPEIFGSWKDQLRTGGILLAPVGRGAYQELIRIIKTDTGFKETRHGGCAFVPLR